AAIAALALAGLALKTGGAAETFVPAFDLTGWLLLWLVAAPIATCLVTAITARLTVLNTLRAQY
ncbi:MAG: hypothetical protein AAFW68_13450, partial [Pseudomonadota bacterium]